VTPVVRLPSIIRQKLHRVVFGDRFRVLFHEFANGLPECRDGGFVFEERDGESVFHLLVLHDEEGIIVEITEELDVRSVRVVLFLDRRRVVGSDTYSTLGRKG
jgi:hypothetical protein